MSKIDRNKSGTLSSAADSYFYFSVHGNCRTSLNVSVAATSTPTGVQYLQRYEIDGWTTYDLGDESFTDPAAGAAVSKILVVLEPGYYRYFYDRTSGGAASGITVKLRVNSID